MVGLGRGELFHSQGKETYHCVHEERIKYHIVGIHVALILKPGLYVCVCVRYPPVTNSPLYYYRGDLVPPGTISSLYYYRGD